MERPPPLNAIRAFEAAGRLESISGAAQEIAQKVLIEADLAAGRLQCLYDRTLDMGATTYYFVCLPGAQRSGALEVFRAWLTSHVDEDRDAASAKHAPSIPLALENGSRPQSGC